MAEATLTPLAPLVAGVHHLFFAPLGTTLPTTVGSAPGIGLDAAFTAVGYTADTGAAFAVDTQTTNLFASQSLDPIRTIVQSKTATIQAPLIEWSASSLTAAFGGGTITAATCGWKYVPPPAGTLDEVSAGPGARVCAVLGALGDFAGRGAGAERSTSSPFGPLPDLTLTLLALAVAAPLLMVVNRALSRRHPEVA